VIERGHRLVGKLDNQSPARPTEMKTNESATNREREQAFTIDEFCTVYAKCCRGTFYNMVREGIGPKLFYIGATRTTKDGKPVPSGVRISKQAAEEWLRAREEAADSDAKLKAAAE
jgi:hypothetical protein